MTAPGRKLMIVLAAWSSADLKRGHPMAMKRFVVEREIPNIGASTNEDLSIAAGVSNSALATLAPRVQWEHSYVTADKTFCVYLAEDEAVIRKHAEVSGFPASTITQVSALIDPTTAA